MDSSLFAPSFSFVSSPFVVVYFFFAEISTLCRNVVFASVEQNRTDDQKLLVHKQIRTVWKEIRFQGHNLCIVKYGFPFQAEDVRKNSVEVCAFPTRGQIYWQNKEGLATAIGKRKGLKTGRHVRWRGNRL